MGMTAGQLGRFMARAEETMQALFPATVKIGGVTYAATGVGGSAKDEYVDGGKVYEGVRFFRILKSALADRPADGTPLEWLTANGAALPVGMRAKFKILRVPDRPQEVAWELPCEPIQRSA